MRLPIVYKRCEVQLKGSKSRRQRESFTERRCDGLRVVDDAPRRCIKRCGLRPCEQLGRPARSMLSNGALTGSSRPTVEERSCVNPRYDKTIRTRTRCLLSGLGTNKALNRDARSRAPLCRLFAVTGSRRRPPRTTMSPALRLLRCGARHIIRPTRLGTNSRRSVSSKIAVSSIRPSVQRLDNQFAPQALQASFSDPSSPFYLAPGTQGPSSPGDPGRFVNPDVAYPLSRVLHTLAKDATAEVDVAELEEDIVTPQEEARMKLTEMG